MHLPGAAILPSATGGNIGWQSANCPVLLRYCLHSHNHSNRDRHYNNTADKHRGLAKGSAHAANILDDTRLAHSYRRAARHAGRLESPPLCFCSARRFAPTRTSSLPDSDIASQPVAPAFNSSVHQHVPIVARLLECGNPEKGHSGFFLSSKIAQLASGDSQMPVQPAVGRRCLF